MNIVKFTAPNDQFPFTYYFLNSALKTHTDLVNASKKLR